MEYLPRGETTNIDTPDETKKNNLNQPVKYIPETVVFNAPNTEITPPPPPP